MGTRVIGILQIMKTITALFIGISFYSAASFGQELPCDAVSMGRISSPGPEVSDTWYQKGDEARRVIEFYAGRERRSQYLLNIVHSAIHKIKDENTYEHRSELLDAHQYFVDEVVTVRSCEMAYIAPEDSSVLEKIRIFTDSYDANIRNARRKLKTMDRAKEKFCPIGCNYPWDYFFKIVDQ